MIGLSKSEKETPPELLTELQVGELVVVDGVVGERTVRRTTKTGGVFVKAPLHMDDLASVWCVWWQAQSAPQPGQRVRLRGEVQFYDGNMELHVRETIPLFDDKPAALEHKLLRFYIACLEAEQMRELEFAIDDGGRRFVLLESGEEHVISGEATWTDLPDAPQLTQWLSRRLLAGRAEQVFVGYPVVTGYRDRNGLPYKVLSPLFYVPVEIKRAASSGYRVLPETAVPELNIFALELLGMSREERVGFVEAVEELEEIQTASSARARMESWLNILVKEGLADPGFCLDPGHLGPLKDGISNTCILYTGERGPIIRNLIADLEDLSLLPVEELRRGPLGVLMGAIPASLPPAAEPQPSIIPSNLAQDRAITSAFSVPLTVVTGPPGTGKSQLIINAIASALARGQTVCFASKNNQAVDVIFERLAAVSDEAVPIRAGTTKYRSNIALTIQRALSRPDRPNELGSAITDWRKVEKDLFPIYQVAREVEKVEAELAAEEARYEELNRTAPRAVFAVADASVMAAAAKEVLALLPLASRPRPFWPWSRRRWKEAKARLAVAWDRLSRSAGTGILLPDEPEQNAAEECLRLSQLALDIEAQRLRIEDARKKLASLPNRWELHERLMEISARRLETGRRLFEANWQRLIAGALPEKRAAASALAEGLAAAAGGGKASIRRLLLQVPDVLHVFPIWGVTNLSARTNFPVRGKLFDLVIIDEASQCDIPSAIPLLYRARRALIIGDPKQLTHITSLREVTEDNLARRFGLTPNDLLVFSYRSRSLFGLASARVGEKPLFLDQHFRSHPAIITFSNDHFYGSRLLILTDESRLQPGPAVSWIHIPGQFRRGQNGRSVVNPPEAEAVVRQLEALHSQIKDQGLTVGVVTPYRAQAEAIRDLVARRLPDLEDSLVVATAHRFQGDERDIIIFSPVVSREMAPYHVTFASNPNLVNVSVTRARQKLIIVGDREVCLASPGVLRDLAQYIMDLEKGGFRSPLERRLFDALVKAGVNVQTGVEAEGYKLDLAVVKGERRIDVECDGASFHRDQRADSIRDERLRSAGWEVVRFSGREIQRNLDECVSRVKELLSDGVMYS
ncbi:DNA helicase-like protein [Thermacetogenium phaeum DSM 12270]|uniref:DNA helicase-like protein n=1 Tax=Thermacetogenium phaeum (strain ATCC BAA-254 / DSM 26808 / PB) TaxID=1089553 RepID=K4LCT8_THEPS|nr:AAA domain-containing protein [Thermacetogenium phaeum]AFV10583.1 DNA helicase-like protein [Thermacetogenium phaeum DSM 12270]